MDRHTQIDLKPSSKDKRKAEIYELQIMLRKIAQETEDILLLNPDGIFGEETETAIKEFQLLYGLPVTGVVNFATWTAIADAYEKARYQSEPCLAICPFPGKAYKTHPGEKSDVIYIVQILLSAISVAYDEFETVQPNGVYDEKTMDAVRLFQQINDLPPTGIVDKITWDNLAENYNTFSSNTLYIS